MPTLQTLWRKNQSNYRYWTEREKKQRELYMMEEAQQQKELERIYSDMYRWAEDEINRFYGKYATAEGIDITEAKKRVTQADIEEYERLAKEYVRDRNFSDRANAEMRLYNATMRINRLEMLKARIGLHLVDGINTIDEYYEKVITDRTAKEIERQAGILGETVTNADTIKRANNIVNASFFNATYSERIWSHQDRLRSMISIELQRGLIAGIGSRQMASNIRREYDVSLTDAHRLMVTELRRVQTDVAMDSYKASGVERYVYLAVNPRACPICRELDGKDFAVAEAEPAKNAPPMHPRCHCTTAPYVDEDDYNAWLNYLSQGGRTSDWNNMSSSERRAWSARNLKTDTSTMSEQSVDYAERRRQRLAGRNANTEGSALKTKIEVPKGTNSEAVKQVTEVIKTLERKLGGNTVDGLSVKFASGLKGVYAKYDDSTKTLLIPKGANPEKVAEALRKENERYHIKWKTDKDYHATETFTGVVWHELGHAIDVSTGQSLSRHLSSNTDLDEKSVKVSVYAGTTQNVRTTKRSEAWAENFSAYMDGGKNKEKVPQEIREMIEEYFKSHRSKK